MLEKLVTRPSLEGFAGTAVFRRGEEYFLAGAVGHLRTDHARVAARVDGTATYQVELRDDDGDLAYDCSCPHAADGNFCKHCVALGLAWLSEKSSTPASGTASRRQKRRDPWRDIKDHLTNQAQDRLIDLLMEVAGRDDRLYRSLLLEAESTRGGGNVAVAFRRAIDSATRVQGFVDWREASTFAGNIDEVADSLAELLRTDTASTLVDLVEYAIEKVEAALEQVDDSNGRVGDIVQRLGALHLKACAMARPDPARLAERLFRFETTLPFCLCSFDAATYRGVLGKQGLRRYQELAEAEWRKVKPRDAKDAYDARGASITRIMERLAEASGDVEELVAIKSRDLSSSYRYLDIAETWTKASKPDKALEWAERGLKAFPQHPDSRLRDFLVVAYLKRKRNDEALQLTWIPFDERPSLEGYRKLHAVAAKLGIWPEQRNRALARVTATIARAATTTTRSVSKPSIRNHSLRVEIALWEKDFDAAWTAAHEGACDRHLLIALAGKLESMRPDDAASLYRRVVPPIVEQTGNAAYEEAIKLIRKTGTLMNARNQSREFGDYLSELRVRFKPKRNFIKLLDGLARRSVAE